MQGGGKEKICLSSAPPSQSLSDWMVPPLMGEVRSPPINPLTSNNALPETPCVSLFVLLEKYLQLVR